MKIRKIVIERFRGIEKLELDIDGDFVCLIGQGDSKKSTILDAIELAITPRYGVQFDDSDFYNLETNTPFTIALSIIKFPDVLLEEDRFGLCLSGFANGECHDEYQKDGEPMLTIRLTVDKSLEPEWKVINKHNPEGKTISAKDREKLGMIKLGGYADYHLTWGKGSALSKITEDTEAFGLILAEAVRAAKSKIAESTFVKFESAATRVEDLGKELGVMPLSNYLPNMDVSKINISGSGFTLHDGQVPIRSVGMGTKRLLIMSVQSELAKRGSAVIIDEFEHGLEPHRIRHLLRKFKKQAQDNSFGQVFLTSHSPVVLEELPTDAYVVRNDENMEISRVKDEIIGTIRGSAEALLGKKVLVCEGKTEVGFVKAYDEYLIEEGSVSFASSGVVPIEGGGTRTVKAAGDLLSLSYKVLLLGDSDTKDISSKENELRELGAEVLIWDGSLSIEERVFADLNWTAVIELLKIAIDYEGDGKDSVIDSIAGRMQWVKSEVENYENWIETPELRKALGETAKSKKWFKNVEKGEKLGGIVIANLGKMDPNGDIPKKLNAIKQWVQG